MTTTIEEALALLDAALPPRTETQIAAEQAQQMRQRLDSMGVFMPTMGGIGTVTKGCPHCGGTAISNYEQDENGNIINQGPYICTNGGCGKQS